MTVSMLRKSVMVIKLDFDVHFSFCFVLKMQKSNKQKISHEESRAKTNDQLKDYTFLPLEAIYNLFSTKM